MFASVKVCVYVCMYAYIKINSQRRPHIACVSPFFKSNLFYLFLLVRTYIRVTAFLYIRMHAFFFLPLKKNDVVRRQKKLLKPTMPIYRVENMLFRITSNLYRRKCVQGETNAPIIFLSFPNQIIRIINKKYIIKWVYLK